jgi:hypothetical protein
MAGLGLGSISPWISGVSAVAGLFGGGGGGGDSHYADDRAKGNMYLGKISNNGATWQDFGDNALTNFGTDYAGQRAAVGKELDYYNRDPNTDTRYAADLARSTSGLDTGVQAAQNASLARSSATGNLSSAGGASSAASGAQSYLGGLGLIAKQNAQVGAANTAQARRESNMAHVTSLETGLAQGDAGRAQYGLGTATADDTIGLNDARNQQAADYSHELSAGQAGLGGLGSIGQTVGTILGGIGGGSKSPSPAASTTGTPGDIGTVSTLTGAMPTAYGPSDGYAFDPVTGQMQVDQYGYPVPNGTPYY